METAGAPSVIIGIPPAWVHAYQGNCKNNCTLPGPPGLHVQSKGEHPNWAGFPLHIQVIACILHLAQPPNLVTVLKTPGSPSFDQHFSLVELGGWGNLTGNISASCPKGKLPLKWQPQVGYATTQFRDQRLFQEARLPTKRTSGHLCDSGLLHGGTSSIRNYQEVSVKDLNQSQEQERS